MKRIIKVLHKHEYRGLVTCLIQLDNDVTFDSVMGKEEYKVQLEKEKIADTIGEDNYNKVSEMIEEIVDQSWMRGNHDGYDDGLEEGRDE